MAERYLHWGEHSKADQDQYIVETHRRGLTHTRAVTRTTHTDERHTHSKLGGDALLPRGGSRIPQRVLEPLDGGGECLLHLGDDVP